VFDFSYLPATAVAGVLGLLGLLIGSFLNVVIHRVPKMMEREWDGDCRELLKLNPQPDPEPYNLLLPRSACPHCGHQIRWYENIPIASYLVLGGKCSGCKAGISPRYPIVELVTGALFAWCGWHHGPTLAALAWCGFAALLLCLTMIDWDVQLLPDDYNYSLLWLGLLASVLGLTGVSPANAVMAALLGYLFLFLITWVFNKLTGKQGMGNGDFKLFAALGAWFGWQALIPIILLSCVVGIALWALMKVLGKVGPEGHMPFGPFLAGAGFLAMLLGTPTLVTGMAVLMGAA
jgi:leader peptidase (prepilin peptidase)/N-methyltransferase